MSSCSIEDSLPYKIVATKRHTYEAERWCKEHLGERWSVVSNRNGKWAVFWAGSDKPYQYYWYFAREEDAVWFTLSLIDR